MSFNRENVTFQTADGKWNIGFWNFYETSNYMDEDFDSEWDVEYTYDGFWFFSAGHATPKQAYEAYCRNHSNPGGTVVLDYATYKEDCDKYAKYLIRDSKLIVA